MKLRKIYFWGIVFIFLLGSLFHFTYELSGNNFFVGIFSALNESTLEHTKLLVYPTLLWYIGIYLFSKSAVDKNRWFTAGLLQLSVSLILVPILFNSYTLFMNHNFIFDILIFLVAIVVGSYVSYKYYESKKGYLKDNFLIFLYLLILYFYFITTIKK